VGEFSAGEATQEKIMSAILTTGEKDENKGVRYA
jgi:hypothetical protein